MGARRQCFSRGWKGGPAAELLSVSHFTQRVVEQTSMEAEINLIAVSKAMQAVLHSINVVASTNAPTLITGESGSGKKIVAQTIHDQSNRANQAFVVVQCTETSEDLIESEIFGYESDSFARSRKSRIGCFELASGGSLLFDNIKDLSPSMQLRVLRIFEKGKIRPLGATAESPVDVRVLVTLERDSGAVFSSERVGRFPDRSLQWQ